LTQQLATAIDVASRVRQMSGGGDGGSRGVSPASIPEIKG